MHMMVRKMMRFKRKPLGDLVKERFGTVGHCTLEDWWSKAKGAKDRRQWFGKASTCRIPRSFTDVSYEELGQVLFTWLIRRGYLPPLQNPNIEAKVTHSKGLEWAR